MIYLSCNWLPAYDCSMTVAYRLLLVENKVCSKNPSYSQLVYFRMVRCLYLFGSSYAKRFPNTRHYLCLRVRRRRSSAAERNPQSQATILLKIMPTVGINFITSRVYVGSYLYSLSRLVRLPLFHHSCLYTFLFICLRLSLLLSSLLSLLLLLLYLRRSFCNLSTTRFTCAVKFTPRDQTTYKSPDCVVVRCAGLTTRFV